MYAARQDGTVDRNTNWILPICSKHNSNKTLDCIPDAHGRCSSMRYTKPDAVMLPVAANKCVQVMIHSYEDTYAKRETFDDSAVMQLTNDRQVQQVAAQGTSVVMFTMTGCKHCQDIWPKFCKKATQSRTTRFFVMNEAASETLARRLAPEGYPTFIKFEHGKASEVRI